jgi:hypothetical protein
MTTLELRDIQEVRQFLLQGLWLQRVAVPTAATVRPTLEWAVEIAGSGQPLPPVGFVGDVGNLLFAGDQDTRAPRDSASFTGWPVGLAWTYEDMVVGKIVADWTMDRAGDALRHYKGRDRARGLAFVINQFRERAGFGGVYLSPAALKGLLEAPPGDVLARGWDALNRTGVQPLLIRLYEDMIAATRRMADALGPEDIFELEHGTALADLGQRVALRQVLQAAAQFDSALPHQRPRRLAGRREVPTQVFDEDTYPVGGFASISTRGTIESLLHSQLAYMEPASVPRPDLFDIKFLRDELLYYSRDENQFLRRRRTFVVVLMPDLAQARFKDIELPTQRIVLVLALLVVLVRRLTDWLSSDALVFDFVLVADGRARPLKQEAEILGMVFREQVANGTVRFIDVADVAAAGSEVTDRARRSQCVAVTVGVMPTDMKVDAAEQLQLAISGPHPRLVTATGELPIASDEALESWRAALESLVRACL